MVSRMSRSSSTSKRLLFGSDAEVMRRRLSRRETSLGIHLDGEYGQLDREGRSGAEGARDADDSSVGLDDLAGDVQPEPEAAVRARRYGSFEAVENSPELVLLDSDSVVANAEYGQLA